MGADCQQVRCIQLERNNVLFSLVELSTTIAFWPCENHFPVHLNSYEITSPGLQLIAQTHEEPKRNKAVQNLLYIVLLERGPCSFASRSPILMRVDICLINYSPMLITIIFLYCI